MLRACVLALPVQGWAAAEPCGLPCHAGSSTAAAEAAVAAADMSSHINTSSHVPGSVNTQRNVK
jgi:hypothetical protein